MDEPFRRDAEAEGGIPQSVSLHENWDDLKRERTAFDATIITWADGLDPAWPEGEITFCIGIAKRDMTRPKDLLLMHVFNHQTHHRGQVHCLLSQAGGKPHETDLLVMPM